MTEPSPARPVPGPPRPGPVPGPIGDAVPAGEQSSGSARFAELDELPVAEHVGVFEAEHDRLQRELGTIDQV